MKDVENNCKDLQSKLSICRESYEHEHKISVTLENALSRLDKPINVVPSTADHQDELIVLPSPDKTITIEKCEDEQLQYQIQVTSVNTNEEVSKSINTKVNSTVDASPVNEISKRVAQLHNREEQIEVHQHSQHLQQKGFKKKVDMCKWEFLKGKNGCRFKNECRYSHNIDFTKKGVCMDMLTNGACNNGHNITVIHSSDS